MPLTLLRKNLLPARQTPPIANKTAVPLSGTAVAAENENCEEAEGSCVVKLNVPGVVVKPLWETFPVPWTVNEPFPVCCTMCEVSKSNVNPSTDQKEFICNAGGILNDQGA